MDLIFQQHNVNYTVTLEAGGWEVIKKYVELGLGISIVTDICLAGNEPIARIPLDQYFPKRSYGLVLRRGKFLSPPAKRFIEAMDPGFFSTASAAATTAQTQTGADGDRARLAPAS